MPVGFATFEQRQLFCGQHHRGRGHLRLQLRQLDDLVCVTILETLKIYMHNGGVLHFGTRNERLHITALVPEEEESAMIRGDL